MLLLARLYIPPASPTNTTSDQRSTFFELKCEYNGAILLLCLRLPTHSPRLLICRHREVNGLCKGCWNFYVSRRRIRNFRVSLSRRATISRLWIFLELLSETMRVERDSNQDGFEFILLQWIRKSFFWNFFQDCVLIAVSCIHVNDWWNSFKMQTIRVWISSQYLPNAWISKKTLYLLIYYRVLWMKNENIFI